MKNPHDNKPVTVKTTSAGPYFEVTVDMLDRVKQLLTEHSIRYWVDHHQISLNGRPFITGVNLGRKGDPVRAQAVLDSVD
jgi:hypothetical protein